MSKNQDSGNGNSNSPKLQVYLAVIALVGTIITAAFANWDKIFPSKPKKPFVAPVEQGKLSVSGNWYIPQFSEKPTILVQKGGQVTGSYPYRAGKIFLGQLNDGQLTAYWSQSNSKVRCSVVKNGSYFWGKLYLSFSDATHATGTWCYCEDQSKATPVTAQKIN